MDAEQMAKIEQYYAPPRGFNNLRTHAKLMAVGAVVTTGVAPYWGDLPMTGVPEFDALQSMFAMLPWVTAALFMIASLVTYAIACHRLGLAVLYGLPEPGIREWPAFRTYLASLQQSHKDISH
jgi:hypothetical protein